MNWISLQHRWLFIGALLATLAGSRCVLDWQEDSRCGNGVIEEGEACDDGGREAGDGCSPTCQMDHGWSCTNEPSLCTTTCGDGIIAAGVETCDQGSGVPVSWDGCSATCQVEEGWTCSGEPSTCTPN